MFAFVCFYNITSLELCTSSFKTTAVSLMGFYIKSTRNERALTFGKRLVQLYLHDKDSHFLFLATPSMPKHNSLILWNGKVSFIEYHSLCVIGAFPWTEATYPTEYCFNNCQPLQWAQSRRCINPLIILYHTDGKCKTVPISLHICHYHNIKSGSIQNFLRGRSIFEMSKINI